ncbi:MAG: NAD-dependent epimerase/dehydratase family protein [Pseudomonadota bacterium]|jgi:predicted dehydrogenase/nucleoside-diphosphate-sugar epimerase|nr:NAD-dependent epimerase/dehydratase family protein [Xanthomonadaceae bacterium]MDE2247015.1 NAD-dependent epimerase/dehydratase family protein [Xanthomonadaceae bacterium]MDE3209789.1 NAD-dependent epimerase/dehydratase family protein [Pseudomonadota bacterium]
MNASTPGKLRIAIVGAGYVARYHIAALRRLEFVEIVGICDLDQAAAQALAKAFGIGLVTADLAALASQRPDAVYVLTPPASHCALSLQALDMGCHVFVEKPMADSVAECDAMIGKARDKGLVLSVDHSDHFDPVIMQALALVKAGKIGDVVAVDVLRSSDYPPYAGGPLPGMVKQGSYPFRDLGVHGLYILESFLGAIDRLDVHYRASGTKPNLKFDEWDARAQCANGIGRLLLSWNVRPMQNRLIVHGTRGVIEVDRFLQICRVRRVLPGPKFIGIVLGAFGNALRDIFRVPWNVLRFATGRLRPSPGIQHGAEAFARALHERQPPPVGPAEGRRPVALMEAVCAQADRQRRDELDARITALEPVDALVTGAAGFLGRALVAALRARGQTVRVLVRRPDPVAATTAGMQVVVGDLGDPRIVDHAVDGAGIVYHVGAAMRGGPGDFEAGTVWGTRNVVDACLKHGVRRLVYVSSLSVLDHAGRDPSVPVREESRFEPHPERRGAYTQTKLTAEHMVSTAIRERGLPAVILRPGQIVGPGAERVTPNGTLALAGRWIAVGPATQTLPLVYVDDVVDALLLAAEAPAALGGTFNLVDPQIVTQGDYLAGVKRKLGGELKLLRLPTGVFMLLASGVEWLGKLLGRSVPLTRYRVRSLRPLANFDIASARSRLGWEPRVGVQRGLDGMFAAGTGAEPGKTGP